jgi:hypothetical protein
MRLRSNAELTHYAIQNGLVSWEPQPDSGELGQTWSAQCSNVRRLNCDVKEGVRGTRAVPGCNSVSDLATQRFLNLIFS